MDRRDFDEAAAGIALVGVEDHDCGHIVRTNRTFADLVARRPEELLGSSFCDLIHPADRAYAVEEFETLIAGQRGACEGEGRLIGKDGRICWVRVHAGLFPSDGTARAVVMIHVTQIAELSRRSGAGGP
jgi:PAS domain S-box-containing protein